MQVFCFLNLGSPLYNYEFFYTKNVSIYLVLLKTLFKILKFEEVKFSYLVKFKKKTIKVFFFFNNIR